MCAAASLDEKQQAADYGAIAENERKVKMSPQRVLHGPKPMEYGGGGDRKDDQNDRADIAPVIEQDHCSADILHDEARPQHQRRLGNPHGHHAVQVLFDLRRGIDDRGAEKQDGDQDLSCRLQGRVSFVHCLSAVPLWSFPPHHSAFGAASAPRKRESSDFSILAPAFRLTVFHGKMVQAWLIAL